MTASRKRKRVKAWIYQDGVGRVVTFVPSIARYWRRMKANNDRYTVIPCTVEYLEPPKRKERR